MKCTFHLLLNDFSLLCIESGELLPCCEWEVSPGGARVKHLSGGQKASSMHVYTLSHTQTRTNMDHYAFFMKNQKKMMRCLKMSSSLIKSPKYKPVYRTNKDLERIITYSAIPLSSMECISVFFVCFFITVFFNSKQLQSKKC